MGIGSVEENKVLREPKCFHKKKPNISPHPVAASKALYVNASLNANISWLFFFTSFFI